MNNQYFWSINWNKYTSAQGIDTPFDPASVAKLFYATYIFTNHDLETISEVTVKLEVQQYRTYRYGTRKLNVTDIGRKIPLLELIVNMLQHSCNISTGLVADYCDRGKVNEFIKTKLKLTNTTVFDKYRHQLNTTTVGDLAKLVDLILNSKLLKIENRSVLLQLLAGVKRRTVIKNILGDKWQVFSKGGTTLAGARRDWAIITMPGSKIFGWVIVVQVPSQEVKLNKIDKVLAKARLGRRHKELSQLDLEFMQQVDKLTQAIR